MRLSFKESFYLFAIATFSISTLVLPVLANDSSGKPGVQITIKTDKLAYQPGEKIVLEIVVKNGLSRNLLFGQERVVPEADYDYRVVGADHQEAPLTRFGRTALGVGDPFVRTKTVNLSPAQSYTNILVMNQIFDLSVPQKYTVTVSRQFYTHLPADNSAVIVSKPVDFAVEYPAVK